MTSVEERALFGVLWYILWRYFCDARLRKCVNVTRGDVSRLCSSGCKELTWPATLLATKYADLK